MDLSSIAISPSPANSEPFGGIILCSFYCGCSSRNFVISAKKRNLDSCAAFVGTQLAGNTTESEIVKLQTVATAILRGPRRCCSTHRVYGRLKGVNWMSLLVVARTKLCKCSGAVRFNYSLLRHLRFALLFLLPPHSLGRSVAPGSAGAAINIKSKTIRAATKDAESRERETGKVRLVSSSRCNLQ